ncbi:MAG: GIY-YIG nuclease family protein [Ignavibacteriae bacterium]|nr:GIY-YIG nuclease family protein [Ignavibacteriota bacterium]MCB0751009.1 GIY-YIG nuclease family protein [Ignavibacteriota bacterium]
MIKPEPYIFDLTIENTKIISWKECNTNNLIAKLSKPLTGSDYKIYVITKNNKVLYVGTTKSSIKSRLNSGLKASGKNGYHGYKWKDKKHLRIFIWNFNELNKLQVENIEAELAFVVRTRTGKWPELQNEIHFNNSYQEKGKELAEIMFNEIREHE